MASRSDSEFQHSRDRWFAGRLGNSLTSRVVLQAYWIGLGTSLVTYVVWCAGCTSSAANDRNKLWEAELVSRNAYDDLRDGNLEASVRASHDAVKMVGIEADGAHSYWALEVDDSWRPPKTVWVEREFSLHVHERHVEIACEVITDRTLHAHGKRDTLKASWDDIEHLGRVIIKSPRQQRAAYRRRQSQLRDQVGRQLVRLDVQEAVRLAEAREHEAALSLLDSCGSWMRGMSPSLRSLLETAVNTARAEALFSRRLYEARQDFDHQAWKLLSTPPIDTSQLAAIQQGLRAIVSELGRVNRQLIEVLQEATE